MNLLLRACFSASLVLAGGSAGAQEDQSVASQSEGWVTKTFSVQDTSLFGLNADGKARPLAIPELPLVNASPEVWKRQLQLTRALIGKELEACLGPMPEGAAWLYDPAKATLAIRTTVERMPWVEALLRHMQFEVAWQPGFLLHVVEAPEGEVQRIVEETGHKANHAVSWQRLRAMVDQGRAKMLGQLRLPTRSGMRVTGQSGEASKAHGLGTG